MEHRDRVIADAGFKPLLRDPEGLVAHVRTVARYARTIVLSASGLRERDRAQVAEAALATGAAVVILTLGAAVCRSRAGRQPPARRLPRGAERSALRG